MTDTTLWFTLMFLASGVTGIAGIMIGYALSISRARREV